MSLLVILVMIGEERRGEKRKEKRREKGEEETHGRDEVCTSFFFCNLNCTLSSSRQAC